MFLLLVISTVWGQASTPPQENDSGGCFLSAKADRDITTRVVEAQTVIRRDQYDALMNILSGLSHAFRVSPKFYIYDDRGSANAFATKEIHDSEYRDGAVMFGTKLIASEPEQTGFANYTIAAIMAHEFAHIVQFKNGSTLSTSQKELQADYLAGWYTANHGPAGIAESQALISFYRKGDYGFNDPDHHGTPEERLRAVQAGVKDARSTPEQALNNSKQFVSQN